MITLTHKQLNEYTRNTNTKCIALNKKQLEILGISWPPREGWVKRLIGTQINTQKHNELLKLKGNKSKKALLKKMQRIEKEVKAIGGKVIWDVDK